MANKPAAYKQKQTLNSIEQWFNRSALEHYPDNPKREQTMGRLFMEYARSTLDADVAETMVGYADFARCMYKLGIIDMQPGGSAEYAQMESWRPSDNMTMRWQPPVVRLSPGQEQYE